MSFSYRTLSQWMGLGLLAALPFCSGCGAVAGSAIGAGIGATTDVTVTPDSITVPLSQQQQYKAQSSKLIGNAKDARPAWDIEGNVGYIDGNGLFTATNSGQSQIRATIKTLASTVSVVGKSKIFVPPPSPNAPRILSASMTPTFGKSGITTATFTAMVSKPAAGEIQKVEAREKQTLLSVLLVDNGKNGGDSVANDGIFTGKLLIPASVLPQDLHFGVHAEDFSLPPNSSEWTWLTYTVSP